VDSYAWIELFLGGEKGRNVKRLIGDADEVRTPDIVLAEVARKYLREEVDETRIRERLETIRSASSIVPIDNAVAFQAGKAFLELAEKAKKERGKSPGLFDAIVLATARVYDSRIITGDEHFKTLTETISI